MRQSGLISERPELALQLSTLTLVYDNEKISTIDIHLSIQRTEWTNFSDPFNLPIYIEDWTGTHEKYIYLQYNLCYETMTEDFSFCFVNVRIDTTLDPNFGILGFRWNSMQ